MSNGHNHSAGCTCTFCENSRVKLLFDTQQTLNFNQVQHLPIQNLFSNRPNASCPVCKEPVFFYKNEYGSAVFFDELGPPWQKHPCTDNTGKHVPFILEYYKTKPSIAKSNGWFPVELISIFRTKNDYYQLNCSSESGNSIQLLISKKYVEQTANLKVISREAICYLRKEKSNIYSVSLLSDDLRILNSKANEVPSDR